MSQSIPRRVGGHLQSVPETRRRPRRDVTVTYCLRVELMDVEPLVWRQVEVASDLTLDRVHDVLQVVMGWQNYHLHEFISGDDPHDRSAEHYAMTFSIDDGAVGIDDRRVRLDEVLVDPGDRLWYQYDFGDDWFHTIDLESIRPREPNEPPARCRAGARACPPEDCGGPGGYDELRTVLAGPPGQQRDEMLLWAGPDFDPARFDVDAVNHALTTRGGLRAPAIDPDSPLGELLVSMRGPIPDSITAALDAMSIPAPAAAASAEPAAAVRLYTGLLDRVGSDGIALTQAGYLPPAQVEKLSADLGLDRSWIGKNNREIHTYPVLAFRESAQHLGLLRKSRNRLLLTKSGDRARRDPGFLWRHIAGALPLSGRTRGPETQAERQAGTLLLLAVAAGLGQPERYSLIADGLNAHGWRDVSGDPLTTSQARHLSGPTSDVLRHIGGLPLGHPWADRAEDDTPGASVALARAALGL